MIDNCVIDKIVALSDPEKGGDNALDGFEFQVSSAIYLMFREILNKNSFILVYEKIEDFIIFTDKIHLYQAKSINSNLTPNVLYRPSRKTKNDESGLSIIEKMNDNYLYVKENAGKYKVDNNLLICENQVFSKKFSKDIKDIEELDVLNFGLLEKKVKSEIIEATKFAEYTWGDINALRLIPKTRHEEVTRIFIEDVVHEILGENKINSLALYNSLTSEIRRIRKKKEKLTYDFILNGINRYSMFEEDLKYSDYVHLLNEHDAKNLLIHNYFSIISNNIKIHNHPNKGDYERLKKLYKESSIDSFDRFYNIIVNHDSYVDICLRLSEYEIKALILIVIAKEMN